MKKLAIILAVILAALLIVCFFLPEQGIQEPTEPTENSTASVVPSATAPTKPTETEPTRPTETQPTQPTQPAPTQPSETQPVEVPEDDDFVLISDWISDVRVELAYATTDNFTGTKIYEFTDAYLRYGTVKKLAAAADILKQSGYGILVWDGYRPVYAQQKLWDVCPDPNYVSPPGTGTQAHCRGIAVDITLYDLETGELLEMPSGFDEFSSLGDRDYSDCTEEAREHALLLETVMEQCGFKPYRGEWWHFSDTVSYEIEYEFDPAGGTEIVDALDTALGSVWYATCNQSMMLRADNNFDAASLATVYPNDTMTLLSWDGVFAKVDYQGIIGYVLTNYIKPAQIALDDVLDTVDYDTCYTYGEMETDLQEFAQLYPNLLTMDRIGYSEWGSAIPVVRVGSTDAEYHVLIHASLHAREHFTTWLAMAILDYWMDNGAADCVDVCYHIIPMVNPDGVTTAQTAVLNESQKKIYQADLAAGYTQLSETEYAKMWKANGAGVDLNRNFDAQWDKINYRNGPSSALYKGTAPFSASEAAALRDYTLQYDFDATISYHTAGSIIYYDYGDNQAANNASESLARFIEDEAGYPLLGSTDVDSAGYKDWAIDKLSIPSITLEVGISQPVNAEREAWSVFARNCDIMTWIADWLRSQ